MKRVGNYSEGARKGWLKRSRTISEETRLKRSNSLKKAWAEGRHRKTGGNYESLRKYYENNSREKSVETREKISESHKGKKLSDEHRRNLSLSHIGKKPVISAESRKKAADAIRGRKLSSEHIEKIRAIVKNRSIETRRKMSLSHSSQEKITIARSRLVKVMKNRESLPEKKIRSQLEVAGVCFERQFVVNNGEFLFDFKVDNILLECDSTYWHSFPKMITQDHRKNIWAKENGFDLRRVSENDVMSPKFDILKVIFNG